MEQRFFLYKSEGIVVLLGNQGLMKLSDPKIYNIEEVSIFLLTGLCVGQCTPKENHISVKVRNMIIF